MVYDSSRIDRIRIVLRLAYDSPICIIHIMVNNHWLYKNWNRVFNELIKMTHICASYGVDHDHTHVDMRFGNVFFFQKKNNFFLFCFSINKFAKISKLKRFNNLKRHTYTRRTTCNHVNLLCNIGSDREWCVCGFASLVILIAWYWLVCCCFRKSIH